MALTGYLKQSATVTVMIGPFVDEDDGKTAEVGLTISQADVRLSKNAANMAQKGEATSCTHDELGYYTCPLNTTDTGTVGMLTLMVHESGALPVRHDYMVISDTLPEIVDQVTAIKAKTDNLPTGVAKNVALSNFMFKMVLTSDHITPATSKSVTVSLSGDGGAFSAATNTPATEVSNGWYKINLTQGEMNYLVIAVKCTATACDATDIMIITDA